MIAAVAAMILVVGVICMGFYLLQDTQNRISDEVHVGQAVSISIAGLTDCLSWFRNRTSQPVTVFQPQLNLSASPPVNETDDPNIGLVREFQISKTYGLWGRYELRCNAHDPNPKVRDISIERNLIPTETSTGNGWAWYLESTGIIFKKANSVTYLTANFYRATFPPYVPNRTFVNGIPYVTIVTSAVTSTEIQRLVVLPPAGGGAICCHTGSGVTLGSNSRVQGGNTKPGVVFPTSTGAPSVSGGAQLSGTPNTSAVSPASSYTDAVTSVFGGMSNSDLKISADLYAESMSALPSTLPDYSLVYFKGNPTFGATHPLQGTGILFVEGNLTLDVSSNSFYSGVIYVQGNYTQLAPSMVRGLVIVTGTVNISGSGDWAELDYDPNIFSLVLSFIGQYRFSKPVTYLRGAY